VIRSTGPTQELGKIDSIRSRRGFITNDSDLEPQIRAVFDKTLTETVTCQPAANDQQTRQVYRLGRQRRVRLTRSRMGFGALSDGRMKE